MKPKWLFENFTIDADSERIVRAVKGQGMEAYAASRVSLLQGQTYKDAFKEDDCVIFYGCLSFADQIKRETKWVPGPFGNTPEFDCTRYFPKLGKWLLAEEYAMLPWGDLERQKESLFEKFGGDGALFMRPNSSGKSFTGQLVYDDSFEIDLHVMTCYDVDQSELVVVSRPRHVMSEWRFIIFDKQVIASSQYRKDRLPQHSTGADDRATDLAWNVAINSGYSPERVWCLDICNTKAGNYYVLEVGCVGCAGWYQCDPEPVVEAMSQVALEKWEASREQRTDGGG